MSKKTTKQVSVNATDKLVTPSLPFTITYGAGEDAISIEVKPRLSLMESATFVNSIAAGIINEEKGTVTYGWKEFVIRINTLELYTNLRLPADFDKKYDLVFSTDIIDRIFLEPEFKMDDYKSLLFAAEDQISFEVEKMLSQFKSETQAMIDHINTEGEQIINTFAEFGKAFKDVTPEQIAAIIPKISEMGKLDERSLASAVLDIQSKKDSEGNA